MWEKGLRRRLESGDKAGRKEGEMVDGGGFQGTNKRRMIQVFKIDFVLIFQFWIFKKKFGLA